MPMLQLLRHSNEPLLGVLSTSLSYSLTWLARDVLNEPSLSIEASERVNLDKKLARKRELLLVVGCWRCLLIYSGRNARVEAYPRDPRLIARLLLEKRARKC